MYQTWESASEEVVGLKAWLSTMPRRQAITVPLISVASGDSRIDCRQYVSLEACARSSAWGCTITPPAFCHLRRVTRFEHNSSHICANSANWLHGVVCRTYAMALCNSRCLTASIPRRTKRNANMLALLPKDLLRIAMRWRFFLSVPYTWL